MKNVNFKNKSLLVLYHSLEEFDSKLLIRSLIFLTFEQKKIINNLNSKILTQGSNTLRSKFANELKYLDSFSAKAPLKNKPVNANFEDLKNIKKSKNIY